MTVSSVSTERAADALPDVRARQPHVGRWIQAVVLALVIVIVVHTIFFSPNLQPSVIAQSLFSPRILEGLGNTLLIAVVAQVLALLIGVPVGFMRVSANPVSRTGSWLYLWIFRSTPLIVQILLWGNLALFLPNLVLGVPFTAVTWLSVPTNVVMTAFVASVIALGLHDGAYIAEIVRSGVLSVGDGQRDAAAALGLSWWQTQRTVVLPQALRVMIPPAGSAFVLLLKSTSMVVVIAGGDLLTEAQNISSTNLRTVELLIVATIWYLLVTSIAAAGQALLERRFSRSDRRRR
ncbi:amino acid ABC transporter permease [Pseudonocardia sp. NPDC049154]|uniref:amino acid ABC transporter permease n=1 Tax=Pseudonocardia sp. NPDC049154 TaxID=3155501 RepID=UPI0033DF4B70